MAPYQDFTMTFKLKHGTTHNDILRQELKQIEPTMKILLEETKWADRTANNMYLVTDDMENLIAYVPEGSKIAQRFKQPIRWDPRGRKFKTLMELQQNNSSGTRRVVGSKGQIYTLTRANGQWQCTCPGYSYRGQCRHAAGEV